MVLMCEHKRLTQLFQTEKKRKSENAPQRVVYEQRRAIGTC